MFHRQDFIIIVVAMEVIMKLEPINNYEVNDIGMRLDGMQCAYSLNEQVIVIATPAYDTNLKVSEIFKTIEWFLSIFAFLSLIYLVIFKLISLIRKNTNEEKTRKHFKRAVIVFFVFLVLTMCFKIIYMWISR